MSYQLWAIAGVLCFILEMIIPGFLMACFGLGAFAAGIAAGCKLGLDLQLLLFSLFSLVVFFRLRPFYLRVVHRRTRMNAEALVGKKGRVIEKIVPTLGQGRAVVEGEDWWAVSMSGEDLDVDETVIVVKVDSAKLVVVKE